MMDTRRPRTACECSWEGAPLDGTIGECVPFLVPCAGHLVYGKYKAKEERTNIIKKLRTRSPEEPDCVWGDICSCSFHAAQKIRFQIAKELEDGTL